jgi:hypothetical protein
VRRKLKGRHNTEDPLVFGFVLENLGVEVGEQGLKSNSKGFY